MGHSTGSIEILAAISWHLECMVLAAAAIDNFRPPADGFQMRMHYSIYVTNLMSAIDMMLDIHGKAFQTALEHNLKTSKFSGADVLGYLRELRNEIVHRGLNPTSGSLGVGALVRAVAPHIVKSRNGDRSYHAPAPLLCDIFVHCEIGTKPIIEQFLETSLDELASANPKSMLDDALNKFIAIPHVPDWVKEMARKHLKPEMLVEAQTSKISKLRELLKPPAGTRIG